MLTGECVPAIRNRQASASEVKPVQLHAIDGGYEMIDYLVARFQENVDP